MEEIKKETLLHVRMFIQSFGYFIVNKWINKQSRYGFTEYRTATLCHQRLLKLIHKIQLAHVCHTMSTLQLSPSPIETVILPEQRSLSTLLTEAGRLYLQLEVNLRPLFRSCSSGYEKRTKDTHMPNKMVMKKLCRFDTWQKYQEISTN